MNYLYDINSGTNLVVTYEDNTRVLINTLTIRPNIASGDTYHVVGQQDTLENLANYYYDDPGKWYIIAAKNGIINPFELELGKQLIIPRL